jgi:hypothetical protein
MTRIFLSVKISHGWSGGCETLQSAANHIGGPMGKGHLALQPDQTAFITKRSLFVLLISRIRDIRGVWTWVNGQPGKAVSDR